MSAYACQIFLKGSYMNKKSKVLPLRNFVAKNAKTGGSGRHKDRKKDYNRKREKRFTQKQAPDHENDSGAFYFVCCLSVEVPWHTVTFYRG